MGRLLTAARDLLLYRLSWRDWRWVVVGGLLGAALLGAGYWVGLQIFSSGDPVVVVPTPEPTPTPAPKHVRGEDRVLSVWDRNGMGHACPISSTDALTADHVAVSRDVAWGPNGGFAPFVVWGDMLGNTGTAQWQWSDRRRDLSLIRVASGTRPFPAFLRRAKQVPKIGDKVYVVGFDFGAGAGDVTVETKVTGVTAGVLVYDKSPGHGSSGSCVLNADGEFVAINVWMVAGEGYGMLVVGDEWSDVPDQFLEGER